MWVASSCALPAQEFAVNRPVPCRADVVLPVLKFRPPQTPGLDRTAALASDRSPLPYRQGHSDILITSRVMWPAVNRSADRCICAYPPASSRQVAWRCFHARILASNGGLSPWRVAEGCSRPCAPRLFLYHPKRDRRASQPRKLDRAEDRQAAK